MAFYSKNFPLDGTTQSLADASPNQHRPIKLLIIENPTGNNVVLVGDSNTTAAIYGFSVTAGPTAAKSIGPFGGGECPFNLENVYVRGTEGETIHLTYLTL